MATTRIASRIGMVAIGATGGLGTVGVSLVAVDPEANVIPGSNSGPMRFLRTTLMTTWTGLDYKWHLRGLERGTPEYKLALHEANNRAAVRLFKVCNAHGGVYTKLGQYVATMNHVLPQEMVDILSPLTDRAKGMSSEDAQLVMENETEKLRQPSSSSSDQQTRVVYIDDKPIAAASIAQVHRARLSDGREVAVKLQYPWLEAQVRGDMRALTVVSRIVGWMYPDFDYHWVLEEFKGNLQYELNFVQEGLNGERVASLFRYNPRVRVPEVVWELTTPRMLTMEFVDGMKVTDTDSLEAAAIEPKEVARLTTQTFSDMIHVHGFVHCDPHAGNLLVAFPTTDDSKSVASTSATDESKSVASDGETSRPKPIRAATNDFQLVLLDHGMYRRLDPKFRRNYCRLWEALLVGDREAGLAAIADMGVPGAQGGDRDRLSDIFTVLSLVLTYRRPGGATKLGSRMSKEERTQVRKDLEGLEAKDVNEFLESLPRDILFVFRTMSIVRSLNKSLGGTSRDRFTAIGDSAGRGIAVMHSEAVQLEDNEFRGVASEDEPSFRAQAIGLQGDLAKATSAVNELVDSEKMLWFNTDQRPLKRLLDYCRYEFNVLQNQVRVRFWVWMLETFTNSI